MDADKITPLEAAQVSDAVYDTKNIDSTDSKLGKTDLAKLFDFTHNPTPSPGTAQRFTARSGAFEFKSKTGFAVMAMGTPGKRYEKHAILICRGTVSAYDWLTDANYAPIIGASGSLVHSGFNRTFNDIKVGINQFLSQNMPQHVHCIGHSLGGALATLAADWLSNNGYGVDLYTFGSPRVGTETFASDLTRKVNRENIFRVCHSSDPVTMVPVWPYMHAPRPDGECWISRSTGVNPMLHRIPTYLATVERNNNWEALRFPTPSMSLEYSVSITSAESLLQLLRISPLIVFSAVVRMICRPLAIVVMPGVSLLDQTAIWIEKASSISVESDGLARTLLQALIKFLGLSITVPQQILHTMLRSVIGYFISIYHKLAGQAVATQG